MIMVVFLLTVSFIQANTISDLQVNHSNQSQNWTIESNLTIGIKQFNDRSYKITALPQWAIGLDWIKAANNSKSYIGSTLLEFTVTESATIYVAHQDAITNKPAWLSSWVDTGDDLVNSNGRTFSIFQKPFTANSLVSLGNNGDTTNGIYTVFSKSNYFLPINECSSVFSTVKVFDDVNIGNWSIETDITTGIDQFNDRSYKITSLPTWAEGLDWLKGANDSKNYTSDPLIVFTPKVDVTIYVAHNDQIANKPAWLSDWEDTSEHIANSNGKSLSLFQKDFSGGSVVSLGSNGNTNRGIYTVLAKSNGSTTVSTCASVFQAGGVKVGEVDNSSAIVWTRKTAENQRQSNGYAPGAAGRIQIRYSPNPNFSNAITTNWVDVNSSTDYSHKFQLTNLQSDRTYHYEVYTEETNGTINDPFTGHFKTAPDEDACQNISFTMMSCMRYDQIDMTDGVKIFDEMAALNPDFAIEAGDLIYYDQDILAKNVTNARKKWERMYSLPNLVNFHKQVPVYCLKDDHDVLKNDAYPGQSYGNLRFNQGVQIFNEQLPTGPLPYHTKRWGKMVQIWFVEGREYRDANEETDGPNKSLWGETQKQWLKNSVQASDADWKILVSPLPMIGPDKLYKKDNHVNNGWQHEGNELRSWIQDNVGDDMIILCGDRHWQYHSIHPETEIHEFCSGSSTDARSGGSPGFNGNYHQYHNNETGGFLGVDIAANSGQSVLTVKFYDENGLEQYEYSREKSLTCNTANSNGIDISFVNINNNQNIAFGQPIGVVVDASDANGSISNVDLYIDGQFVRRESYKPFEWGSSNNQNTDAALQNLPPGSYTLAAVATDNNGNTMTAVVTINIITTVSLRAIAKAFHVSPEFGQKSKLNWYIIQEENKKIKQYIVRHRSYREEALQPIATISAEDTDRYGNYEYIHKNPVTGRNFYQVVIQFEDGTEDYQLIDDIEFAEFSVPLVIAPNPTSDFIKVDITGYMNQPTSYMIINLRGEVVKKGKVDANHGDTLEVNLDELINGLYIIQLQPKNYRTVAAKFVVAKDY